MIEILTNIDLSGQSAIFNLGDYSISGTAVVNVTGLNASFDEATGLVWYQTPTNDSVEAWTTVTRPL